MHVPPGSKLLGRIVGRTQILNLNSLARQEHLSRDELRSALLQEGAIPSAAPTWPGTMITVDRFVGREVAAKAFPVVPEAHLLKVLRVPGPVADALISAGIVLRHERGEQDAEATPGFDRRRIHAVLSKLELLSTPVAEASPELRSFGAYAYGQCTNLEAVLKAMLRGQLKTLQSLNSTPGFLGLFVDPSEVDRILRPQGRGDCSYVL